MSNVAVIKPDHIGDFILSVPAFRALENAYGGFDLFAPKRNLFLKNYFLSSTVVLNDYSMPHLEKIKSSLLDKNAPNFSDKYDHIIYLRDDGYADSMFNAGDKNFLSIKSVHFQHETSVQRDSLAELIGFYSPDLLFPSDLISWPKTVKVIGISLSAGFYSNKIPLFFWINLAKLLIKRMGVDIFIIGGPSESEEAMIFASILGLSSSKIIIGDLNLGRFECSVSKCDIVIGADSGTLHLISTFKNVLGIFTASPWWRFAPYGRFHRVLYYDINCRPCVQFSKGHLNGCLTRECFIGITEDSVLSAINSTDPGPITSLGGNIILVDGASHLIA